MLELEWCVSCISEHPILEIRYKDTSCYKFFINADTHSTHTFTRSPRCNLWCGRGETLYAALLLIVSNNDFPVRLVTTGALLRSCRRRWYYCGQEEIMEHTRQITFRNESRPPQLVWFKCACSDRKQELWVNFVGRNLYRDL